jgi:hypothetical protein
MTYVACVETRSVEDDCVAGFSDTSPICASQAGLRVHSVRHTALPSYFVFQLIADAPVLVQEH